MKKQTDRPSKDKKKPSGETKHSGKPAQPEAPFPVRIGVYSQQELAYGDVMRTILNAFNDAYESGLSRKHLRKESGLKKKAFRRIEDMDMNARLGDVLQALKAAGKTLAVVDLPKERPDTEPGGISESDPPSSET